MAASEAAILRLGLRAGSIDNLGHTVCRQITSIGKANSTSTVACILDG